MEHFELTIQGETGTVYRPADGGGKGKVLAGTVISRFSFRQDFFKSRRRPGNDPRLGFISSEVDLGEGSLFNSSARMPLVLGFLVVVSLVVSKYFEFSSLFFLTVVLASILYQRETNRQNNRTDTVEETLINVSKFIIVTGIIGYIALRMISLFLPGFE
jgi:hypothetical protein